MRSVRRSGAALVALLVLPLAATAQGYRGWSSTSLRYAELRPLGVDSISRDQVTERADGTFVFDGQQVFCSAGTCVRYAPRPVDHALLASQEVGLTAWGFGVQGLSFTTLLRSRAQLSGEFDWPRGDDHFDALLAYAQLVRGPYRVRLGRQETLGGLGSSAFDGADLLASWRDFRIRAYGGRSLARGLREPRNDALRGLQDFVPDQEAYLVGGAARWQGPRGTSVEARYQREIWEDRHGLISDRGSLDFRTAWLDPVRIDGSADYDFGFGDVGKAHLTLAYPFQDGRATVEATARRYRPYFELSTVWGFFRPVAYHEVELRGTWSSAPETGVTLWAAGALRTYEDAEVNIFIVPLTDDSERLSLGGRWRASDVLSVTGSYRLERNPGAYLSSGDVSAQWSPSERIGLTATGVVLQQIEEFRLGEGVTLGAGLSGDVAVTDRIRFGGGLSVYDHQNHGRRSSAYDWSQIRGWSSLRVEIGRDPGMTGRDGR